MRVVHKNAVLPPGVRRRKLTISTVALVMLVTSCNTDFELAGEDGGIEQNTDEINVECVGGGEFPCDDAQTDAETDSADTETDPDTDTGTDKNTDAEPGDTNPDTSEGADLDTYTVSDSDEDDSDSDDEDTDSEVDSDSDSEDDEDSESGSDTDTEKPICPVPPYECKNPTACKNTGGEDLESYGCPELNSVCCSYM